MEEQLREFNPEEEPQSIPMEEPTPEGEISPETPPTETEVPEKERESIADPTDWKALWQKESDHSKNLERLTGKWANEMGAIRETIRTQFAQPKPQETYDPETDRAKFESDPRAYVRQTAPAPDQYVQPILNEVAELKFRLAHPDYYEGDNLKPDIRETINEVLAEESWLAQVPILNLLNALSPLVKLKELQKGMEEGVKNSAKQLAEQQVKSNMAKQKAKLADTGGTKYEKPLKDMTLEELEKVLPVSNRPL